MTTLAYAASDSAAMVGRSVKHTVRNLESLLMSVILPVVLMLLFVYVFGGAIDPSGALRELRGAGIILLCTGYGAASTAVDVAQDMAEGVAGPVPVDADPQLGGAHRARGRLGRPQRAGHRAGDRGGVPDRFRPDAGALEWLAVAGVLLLWCWRLSWMAVCFGLIARTVEGANGFTFLVLFLPYLSSAFVPVETMKAGCGRWRRTSRSRRSPRRCAGCCSAPRSASHGWQSVLWWRRAPESARTLRPTVRSAAVPPADRPGIRRGPALGLRRRASRNADQRSPADRTARGVRMSRAHRRPARRPNSTTPT
jgi:ABC-2 type transport system permease protein